MEKIIIEDRNCLIRVGIKNILEIQYPNAEVFVVEDMHSLTEQVLLKNWDLVIADLELPLCSYIDAIKKIKISHPGLPILVLSMYNPELYAMRVLHEGITGYLNKNTPIEELITAVEKCREGKKYISEKVVEKLINHMDTDKEPHYSLTNKELEIFILFALGKSVEEIADYFSMTNSTSRAYRTRILNKMHIQSSFEINEYAISHHLYADIDFCSPN